MDSESSDARCRRDALTLGLSIAGISRPTLAGSHQSQLKQFKVDWPVRSKVFELSCVNNAWSKTLRCTSLAPGQICSWKEIEA